MTRRLGRKVNRLEDMMKDPYLPDGMYMVSMRGATRKMLRGFPGEPEKGNGNANLCKYVDRSNIINGVIVTGQEKVYEYEIQKKDLSHIILDDSILILKYYPNDVVLTNINDITLFSTDFYLLQPDTDIINPYYLYAILSNHQIKKYINCEDRQYCKNTDKYIKLDALREFQIPVCRMEDQLKIAKECKEYMEIILREPSSHKEEHERICHLADEYAQYVKLKRSAIQRKPNFI